MDSGLAICDYGTLGSTAGWLDKSCASLENLGSGTGVLVFDFDRHIYPSICSAWDS
jgi:hypothetical protein